MRNDTFVIYSFVTGYDISGLDEIIQKILSLGYNRVVIDVTTLKPREIDMIKDKYSNIILRWHLSYSDEKTRAEARKALKRFIRKVYYDLGRKYCSIFSIDEEYADILSPNDLRYFDIIKLKKYSLRTINRYLQHNYLFEILIDNLLQNITDFIHILPKIKVIEEANKVLISQLKPVFKPQEISIIYFTLLDEWMKSYKEPYMRLNRVIDRCL